MCTDLRETKPEQWGLRDALIHHQAAFLNSTNDNGDANSTLGPGQIHISNSLDEGGYGRGNRPPSGNITLRYERI